LTLQTTRDRILKPTIGQHIRDYAQSSANRVEVRFISSTIRYFSVV
jgi:hypothetical protein